jgi:hypothetical protein
MPDRPRNYYRNTAVNLRLEGIPKMAREAVSPNFANHGAFGIVQR